MRERDTNDWISIGAYARRHGVSRNTVYKWLTCGILEHYRVPPNLVRIRNMPPSDHDLAAPVTIVGAPSRSRRDRQPVARCQRQPVPTSAGVYFVRSGVNVKIGYASNLQTRLQSLQAGSFAPLIIVGYILTPDKRAAQREETQLHHHFRDEHVRGEWFRLTEAVVTLLEDRGVCDRSSLLIPVTRQPDRS